MSTASGPFASSAPPSIAETLRRQLDEEGKHAGVSRIFEGDFICIDGEPYQYMRDGIKTFPSFEADPQAYYEDRVGKLGTYSAPNNGKINYVAPDGRKYAGIATRKNLQVLKDAGYRPGEYGTELSNGEQLVHPDTRALFDEMKRRADLELDGLHRQEFRSECARYAREAGVRTPTSEILSQKGVRFMKADGMVYAGLHVDLSRYHGVIPSARNPQAAWERPRQAGTLAQNNGVLAFVDPEGSLYVGNATGENYAALKKAGYKDDGFFVPFSNGEQAVSWETQYDRHSDSVEALDARLIGDMQENLGHERDSRNVMQWYERLTAKPDQGPAP